MDLNSLLFYHTGLPYNIIWRLIVLSNGNNISIATRDDLKEELERGMLKVLSILDEINTDIDATLHKRYYSTIFVQDIIFYAQNTLKISEF
ncbi:MAG: hypothetical protein JXA46_12960 [Dehalococcoidales bacterium]|nr:hypothetical protein [Dehalococcoidales bacterium]